MTEYEKQMLAVAKFRACCEYVDKCKSSPDQSLMNFIAEVPNYEYYHMVKGAVIYIVDYLEREIDSGSGK